MQELTESVLRAGEPPVTFWGLRSTEKKVHLRTEGGGLNATLEKGETAVPLLEFEGRELDRHNLFLPSVNS